MSKTCLFIYIILRKASFITVIESSEFMSATVPCSESNIHAFCSLYNENNIGILWEKYASYCVLNILFSLI